MTDRFLGDAFWVGLPVFAVTVISQCGARLPILKLLDRVVRGASLLTGGMFECDLAHRRSVTVLCILHKIECSPLHPLYGSLPGPLCQCGLSEVLWLHIDILN